MKNILCIFAITVEKLIKNYMRSIVTTGRVGGAVSYTHLDVYKRQVSDQALLRLMLVDEEQN